VITNVSRDHTHILGSTVRQIAWEKAGIIKPNVPVVCGVNHPDALELVEQVCRERQAPLILLGRELQVTGRRSAADHDRNRHDHPVAAWVDVQCGTSYWTDLPVALRGRHQAGNTALALGALEQLRTQGMPITDSQIQAGLSQVEWPARVEVIGRQPAVVIDAAHNWESTRALLATLDDEFPDRRRILIFAATRDKDVSGLLRLLIPAFDTIVFTRYLNNPRSVPPQELLAFVHAVSNRPVHVADTPAAAWDLARHWAGPDDVVTITGSFFLIAELRDLVLQNLPLTASKQGQ
jgi:dihydrofolate synthase/folylpolyglutamate synthase